VGGVRTGTEREGDSVQQGERESTEEAFFADYKRVIVSSIICAGPAGNVLFL
jgi:hypothetical protein